MVKISSSDDFRRLITQIIKNGRTFSRSLTNMSDPYDFDEVYAKIIKLSSSYLEVEVDDSKIPFSMKFDLVTLVMELIHGDEGTNQLINRICNTSTDADLISRIKGDARVIVDVSNLGVILDYFELPCFLLQQLNNNLDTVPKQNYDIIINRLSMLLDTLSSVIQQKLYNEKSKVLNKQVTEFIFHSSDINKDKVFKTEVYKLLSVEYPEVLETFQVSMTVLKRLQTRQSILI